MVRCHMFRIVGWSFAVPAEKGAGTDYGKEVKWVNDQTTY